MIQITEIWGVSYPFDDPRSFNTAHFTKPIFARPITNILVRTFSTASTTEMRRRGNQLLKKTTEAIPCRLDFIVVWPFHLFLHIWFYPFIKFSFIGSEKGGFNEFVYASLIMSHFFVCLLNSRPFIILNCMSPRRHDRHSKTRFYHIYKNKRQAVFLQKH